MEVKTKQQHIERDIPNTPIRFLFHVSKPHKWWALGALLLVTVATSIGSVMPYIFKLIIDGITASQDSSEQLHALVTWGGLYIIALAVMWVFWRLSGFIGLHWITRTAVTAYEDLYEYVTAHSHSYFTDRFAGSIANKISHAADGTERLIDHGLWGYYDRVLGLVIIIALMMHTNLAIGSIFFGLILALVAVNIPLVKYRRPHIVALAESTSEMKGLGVDVLTNIAAVRQYAHRRKEIWNVSDSLETVRRKDVRQWRMGEWALVLNNALIVAALSAIMIIVIRLFKADSISTGDIVLVLTLIFQASGSLTFIGNTMAGAVRMYGEIEEGLVAVLEPYEILDRPNARELTISHGEIHWQNVTFKFDQNKVFTSFDLTIPSGQRVGLVGSSGAGKTTFVSLMLRQHDLDYGSIEIDGQNIAEVTQDSLRQNIAIVPQEPLLFHRTIRENIAYGKLGASDGEVETVARKAQAHDFIVTLPDGYDTLVGERGVKLSGGQRQRVAIARAMLKDAPILVLDEATSALDSESEVAIQKALHELMEGKTVVAIAHRLSTLREMDRIIVLDNGQLIEDGTHDELVEKKGVYASLWSHQAGGFLVE